MSEKHKTAAKTPETKSANAVSRKPETASSQTVNSPIDRILSLQRNIGNKAVQKLLKSGAIQAKLRIGQPNDIYEQEADRLADAVMSMPEPQVLRYPVEEEEEELLQTKPKVAQSTPFVQRQDEPEEEEEEEPLQTKGGTSRTSEITSNMEDRINAMRGGGQPLPESIRAFFEPRFGRDFSKVRIHTDSKAGETAKSLNAKAFTTGKDVVLGDGQYSPDTSMGKRLLAHELTHVMQQTEKTSSKKEPNLDKKLHIQQANMEIQLKKIKVGDNELPKKEDLNFTIATVLGESSAAGPISEKTGIAMVLKRRVEEKWKGKSTFRDIILNTGVYGNPTGSALARLAELYLNDKAENLEEFKKLVDKVKTLRKSDRDYLKTKGGFKAFVERIEQSEMAVDFVLAEAKFEPTLETISKEATWWGGEMDMWDAETGKFRRHGSRVAKNELVFVVYKEIGKTYFLKTAASIKDKEVRDKEVKRSKKFLCDELERRTKWTEKEIEKNNPICK